MFRSVAVALSIALISLSPPTSAVPLHKLPLRLVTADGAWDCRDGASAPTGTLVIADTTYAFITTDGRLGGYGRLHRTGEDYYDLPNFVVLDGYMKDALGAHGATMRGPKGDTDNFAAGIFLILILPEQVEFECSRREAPHV